MPLISQAPPRALQWCSTLQSGAYGFSSQKQSTGGSGFTTGVLSVSPVYFHRAAVIDRIGLEITTASVDVGAVLRIGVYADNGNLFPGGLLLDAGTVAADSLGVKEITLSPTIYIPAGVVWVGAAWQLQATTRAAVRAVSGSPPIHDITNAGVALNNSGFLAGGSTTGALPTTFTAGGGRTTLTPRIFWRLA